MKVARFIAYYLNHFTEMVIFPLKTMITIRDATPRDHAAVCELSAALDDYHIELDSDTYQRFAGDRWPLEQFEVFLNDGGKAFFVAEDGDDLVALLTCELAASQPYPMVRPRTIVNILDLFVRPERRQCGVARALVETAKGWGRTRNADRIRITAHAANGKSVSAYHRLGFSDFMHVMVMKLEATD